jgi:periplasmic protein TonB
MFDKLVESAKQKQGGRARRLFLATSLIYAVALSSFGVMAIMGFSPALAGEYNLITQLLPPPPPLGVPESRPNQPILKAAPSHSFVDLEKVKKLPPLEWSNDIRITPNQSVPGAPPGGSGHEVGTPDGSDTNPPPPPPPTPTPVVKPVATPTPDSVVRLTSVLTQGRALRKVEPPYPTIAKQTRVQGMVQVQIGISETGEVNDVILLSGHPLLRDAALRAAKQWLFIPTELNGRPVRAIGLITFNFKLD